MAASVKLGSNGPGQVLVWRNIDVTLDNSYPSGGYALGASNFGFSKLHAVLPMPVSSGYVAQYNAGTGKLLIFRVGAAVATPLAEVPAATDVSSVVIRVFGLGER